MPPPDKDDEFFIGYAPPMPPRTAAFVTRAVAIFTTVAAVGAGAIALGHRPLTGGNFEYSRSRTFHGVLHEHPYPAIRLDNASEGDRMPLLVGRGKHGADALIRGMDGHHATVSGKSIARDEWLMIEIGTGSVHVDDGAGTPGTPPPAVRVGAAAADLTGEIVDPKCFLGVMVPGDGKTHKDCASLCLRGGVPPALFVADSSGRSALLLLTGPQGEPVGDSARVRAGERVRMTGAVVKENGWLVLRTDPATWRPTAPDRTP